MKMAATMINEKPQKISLKRIHYSLMTDEQTETWGDVKTLTMPISLTLTPNFSEASLDAGDRVVDQEAQMDSITIAGETADLPTEVLVDWYGHKKSAEGGIITNSPTIHPTQLHLALNQDLNLCGSSKQN